MYTAPLKFRAWDKNDGMLYPEIESFMANLYASHRVGVTAKVVFKQKSHNGNGKYHEDPDPNLENLVWMQSTGLKENEDMYHYSEKYIPQELFAGDIIEFLALTFSPGYSDELVYTVRGVVVFKDGTFIVKGYEMWNDGEHKWHSIEQLDVMFKIIGNIFENPELIEDL